MTAHKQPQMTPDELRARCEAVQQGWDRRTELARRGIKMDDYHVEIKTLKTGRTEPNVISAMRGFLNAGADSGR